MIAGIGADAVQVQNPGVQMNQHDEGHLKLRHSIFVTKQGSVRR
jgi:hypothetical protein